MRVLSTLNSYPSSYSNLKVAIDGTDDDDGDEHEDIVVYVLTTKKMTMISRVVIMMIELLRLEVG